tara:strand:+ start:2425 stop:2616 length:192 start_codon:yes stop_codon:yes gene_type:complete
LPPPEDDDDLSTTALVGVAFAATIVAVLTTWTCVASRAKVHNPPQSSALADGDGPGRAAKISG